MKRILRSRLPQRLAGKVPPLIVEIMVALLVVAAMTLLRFVLVPWIGGLAPYAFVFVAVAAATVLAGWRSGLLALVLGQLLVWNLIVDLAVSATERMHLAGGFIVATLAQAMVLAIFYLYQREVDRAWFRREEQVDLIHRALEEIDHRTANNYQTVLALISAQVRTADTPVKHALQQVSDRIMAIASAQKQMTLKSGELGRVSASRHLEGLCGQIRQGLTHEGVSMSCRFEEVDLSSDQATYVSILVNELVTNALKHAFPDGRAGTIDVELIRSGEDLLLVVADNGTGINRTARKPGGVGMRLVATFVTHLGAQHSVETPDGGGTRHRIRIPIRH